MFPFNCLTWNVCKLCSNGYIGSLNYANLDVCGHSYYFKSFGGMVNLILPHLGANEYREIKFYGVLLTRGMGWYNLTLENQEDVIMDNFDLYNAEQYKSYDFCEGVYIALGIGSERSTTWYISKIV